MKCKKRCLITNIKPLGILGVCHPCSIKVKEWRRHWLYVTMSRFFIGSLKSANCVGNINNAESLQKKINNLLTYEKGHHHLGQVIVQILHLHSCVYSYSPCQVLCHYYENKIEICEFRINFVMSLWLIIHKFLIFFANFLGIFQYLCKYWTLQIYII